MSEYLEKIAGILHGIESSQAEALQKAGERVCKVIAEGGLIHIFGCGHSHLPGLDAFYRAGGLANVSPMLDTDLMLHNGAAKSSRMEKMNGIGSEIFRRYQAERRDMLIVFSLSGKNAVPIELADCARKEGVYTVAVSSSAYFEKGGCLHRHSDLFIDCMVPYGDAVVSVGSEKMGGLSTAAFCFILNSLLIDGAKLADRAGADVPIYRSGNIEGGREHNLGLEEKYLGRIKHL